MRCDRCKAESPLEEQFARQRRSMRRAALLCPACLRREQCWNSNAAFIVSAIMLVPVLVDWSGWIIHQRDYVAPALPDFAQWALFYLLMCASIIPHELAHAAAGWLAGIEVWSITLGRGRRIASFKFRQFVFELRSGPNIGYVTHCVPDYPGRRWREFVLIAAGPLANLVLLILSLILANTNGPVSPAHGSRHGFPWIVLAAANALLLIISLFGKNLTLPSGKTTCDGRKLARLLSTPRPDAQTRRYQNLTSRAGRLLVREEYAGALALLRPLLIERPADVYPRGLAATAMLGMQNLTGARAVFRQLLDEYQPRDATRAWIANCLAWTDLVLDDPQFLDEAVRQTAEAFALMPWEPSVQSTRGYALVITGNLDEGERLLRKALAGAELPNQRAAVLCALAIARIHRGQIDAARPILTKVRQLYRTCELLAKAERLISEQQSVGCHGPQASTS
ncbi:MAG TPA: site-2 protease family protein [Tepidisphaeraceae bacterium]|jgi:tetratricopeptide (TPR) repeat protein|nr:site-2 protease family protein [Tepidisphaeraceae bacterium]